MDENKAREANELVAAARAAIADDDYSEVLDILEEALGHLRDYSRREENVWDREVIRDCCHDIGDMIDDDRGFEGLQHLHHDVYYDMGPIVARHLEYFWNGCGDWRS